MSSARSSNCRRTTARRFLAFRNPATCPLSGWSCRAWYRWLLTSIASRPMKHSKAVILILLALLAPAAEKPKQTEGPEWPKVFLERQEAGFEKWITGAIVTKEVPVIITVYRNDADFVLSSAMQAKEETTGGKVVRCLFIHCIGITGNQMAAVSWLGPMARSFGHNSVRKREMRTAIRAHLKLSPST